MQTATTAQPRHQYQPVKPGKLKYRGIDDFFKLPFVAYQFKRSSTPCWNVPATGGYFGGYQTGQSLALLYLKQQRLAKGNYGSLVNVVESMMMAYEREGGKAMHAQAMEQWSESFNAFRGQYHGFFNTIAELVMQAAKQLSTNINDLSVD